LPQPGAYVKALRRAHQLTQSDLAERIEVGRGTIERIEHGDDHVYVGTVVRVLAALGAAPWLFFDLAIQQPPHSLDQSRHQLQIVRGIAT
jgi:transcriptional regulator with XRE-family HTH domain